MRSHKHFPQLTFTSVTTRCGRCRPGSGSVHTSRIINRPGRCRTVGSLSAGSRKRSSSMCGLSRRRAGADTLTMSPVTSRKRSFLLTSVQQSRSWPLPSSTRSTWPHGDQVSEQHKHNRVVRTCKASQQCKNESRRYANTDETTSVRIRSKHCQRKQKMFTGEVRFDHLTLLRHLVVGLLRVRRCLSGWCDHGLWRSSSGWRGGGRLWGSRLSWQWLGGCHCCVLRPMRVGHGREFHAVTIRNEGASAEHQSQQRRQPTQLHLITGAGAAGSAGCACGIASSCGACACGTGGSCTLHQAGARERRTE